MVAKNALSHFVINHCICIWRVLCWGTRTRSIMQVYYLVFALFLTVITPAIALANDKDSTDNPVILEAIELETVYSEEGIVKLKVIAPKALRYENEDQEYPEGVYVELYKAKDQSLVATARANSAYYTADQKVFEFIGDVEVISLSKQRQLNTEALFWDPDAKRFYTDKFIRIESEDNLLTGEGLDAQQDLSQYYIPHPRGTVGVQAAE